MKNSTGLFLDPSYGSRQRHRTKNILLVEYESDLQKIIAFLLEREGYLVSAAPTAEEALSLCKIRRPDLIISDLQFAGMDGVEFLRRVRSQASGGKTPLVFLSGSDEESAAKEAEELGAAAYITKPFDVNDFVRTVKDVVPFRR